MNMRNTTPTIIVETEDDECAQQKTLNDSTEQKAVSDPLRDPTEAEQKVVSDPLRDPTEAEQKVVSDPLHDPTEAGQKVVSDPLRDPTEAEQKVVSDPLRDPTEAEQKVVSDPLRDPTEAGQKAVSDPLRDPKEAEQKDVSVPSNDQSQPQQGPTSTGSSPESEHLHENEQNLKEQQRPKKSLSEGNPRPPHRASSPELLFTIAENKESVSPKEPETEEGKSDPPEMGEKVFVETSVGLTMGVVKYIGETQFQPGLWIGVVLDRPSGEVTSSVCVLCLDHLVENTTTSYVNEP